MLTTLGDPRATREALFTGVLTTRVVDIPEGVTWGFATDCLTGVVGATAITDESGAGLEEKKLVGAGMAPAPPEPVVAPPGATGGEAQLKPPGATGDGALLGPAGGATGDGA